MTRYRLLGVFALAGALTGCGGDNLHPVSGTVTYQGKPIEGATVNLYSPELKTSAYGRTDSSGRFQASTPGSNDGAPAGKYTVTISKLESNGPPVKEIAPGVLDPNPRIGKTVRVIPEKYGNPDTSGLTAEVTPGGKNEFAFDLK